MMMWRDFIVNIYCKKQKTCRSTQRPIDGQEDLRIAPSPVNGHNRWRHLPICCWCTPLTVKINRKETHPVWCAYPTFCQKNKIFAKYLLDF